VFQVSYIHNRADYERFQSRHPAVIDSNYLPFMLWHLEVEGSDEAWLVLCRWKPEDFPLAVHVVRPELAEDVQDEIHPTDPSLFVQAVERALATWESNLEGFVAFRQVDGPDEARLVIRLVGDEAPLAEPGRRGLGRMPHAQHACRALPTPPEAGRVAVEFSVPELWIYVADEFGLLNPDQVERVALHEIGHALGMRGHSPIPNDLMYEVAADRSPASGLGLSVQDVNSFVSLYALPNGTVYGRVAPGEARLPKQPEPPSGPPRLDLAPHVDSRLDFELQLPEGWRRVETPTGLVAIDGLTWDYAASIQLVVRRYPSLESYLTRHAGAHVRDGRILEQGPAQVAGRRAFRLVVASATGELVDETTVVESGDGRVFVFIADCAPEACPAYAPWFEATLESLEIGRGGAGEDREYQHRPE
jgi:predicted Zn-dependent protease